MSFTDNLKKSLGFEEDDFGTAYGISDYGEEDFFEDEFTTISPEQTFYEIVLIRPKSVDDMDYIFDQIVEENNPVILDLKFLEKQSEKDFRQAGEILKLLRHQYGAEAILLSQTEELKTNESEKYEAYESFYQKRVRKLKKDINDHLIVVLFAAVLNLIIKAVVFVQAEFAGVSITFTSLLLGDFVPLVFIVLFFITLKRYCPDSHETPGWHGNHRVFRPGLSAPGAYPGSN